MRTEIKAMHRKEVISLKNYEEPEMNVILLGEDDIRTDNGGTSGGDSGNFSLSPLGLN